MQNDLIKQWIETNKLAIDSFKEIASTNVNAVDKILTSFVNPSASAELTKSSISAVEDLSEVYTDSVNELFQNQLKLVNLQATSDSVKNLGDIYVSSISNLGQKQAELMSLYIETTANYLESLKGAKKLDDVINVQSSTLSEFLEKWKTNMVETMGVFNSISSAMEVWTQKSLDAVASDEV